MFHRKFTITIEARKDIYQETSVQGLQWFGRCCGRDLRTIGRLFTGSLPYRRSQKQRQNFPQRYSICTALKAWTDLAVKIPLSAVTETPRVFSQI